MQSCFTRWSEVSLRQVGHFFIFAFIYPCAMRNDSKLRWTIGGVVRLSVAELEDEGGEGRSAKGKRGHP